MVAAVPQNTLGPPVGIVAAAAAVSAGTAAAAGHVPAGMRGVAAEPGGVVAGGVVAGGAPVDPITWRKLS